MTHRAIAFLFAGQGAESPGMGAGLVDTPAGRELLQLAADLTHVDVFRAIARFSTPLQRTEVLQPVLTALCLAAVEELKAAGIRGQFFAGHSLGELSAWSAAGGPSAADTVRLAAERGRLMAEAAAAHPGGMRALFTDRAEQVADAIERGRAAGLVDLAAINAPDEWVLAGEPAALEAAAGAGLRSVALRSAGPWHSRGMAPAVEPFRARCLAVATPTLSGTLIANRTGEPATGAEIPNLLAEQLVHPVQWVKTMRAFEQAQVTDVVVVGPAKILRGLVRKNLGASVTVHSAEDSASLSRTVAALGARG